MEHTAAIYLNKIQANTSQFHYDNDGLFGGKLGLVWQSYYYWQATREYAHQEQCLRVLGEIFENLNQDNPQLSGASLSVGAAGFCYVVTMLHREGWLEFDLDETLADLDEFAYESALEMIAQRKLDFWHGAFGVLFYLLERLSNPLLRQRAEELVQKIVDKVQGDDDGLWFPNILSPEDESVVNLSLSHGQTAFMLVLMQAAKKGVQTELATSVVWRGVNFVVKHHKSADMDTHFSLFPLTLNADTEEGKFSNRLALCYGDLNILLLMYRAADFLQRPDLRRQADLCGVSTVRRQTEKATLVSDSHLCHGASGVAQLYYRLYKLTGHESYYRAYLLWIDKTIALLDQDLEEKTFKGQEGSLLNGYVGIQLVLLTYIYHQREQLDWAKVFLM
ncbi:lanthionine synthetase C family protein [Runella slithyformis]|uniref:Lanthionine synthetase C family protein n=1 Tax=Runella slithyformis (strain ATCC 29530 / DSM 19594 / LMG 11500 / NCIMB 11436 / LSU 4) TaxID=761193 RepID=A0A7U3ZKG1_RUNSL|nr:lanthionine synthetase C family protein [Runella slithyformis]AEI48870.1 Lanthionine synthetase C family protein [Runella slithyformis DSM 19594]